MAKQEGVTEALKATDQMKWVGKISNICAGQEELSSTNSHMLDRQQYPLISRDRCLRGNIAIIINLRQFNIHQRFRLK